MSGTCGKWTFSYQVPSQSNVCQAAGRAARRGPAAVLGCRAEIGEDGLRHAELASGLADEVHQIAAEAAATPRTGLTSLAARPEGNDVARSRAPSAGRLEENADADADGSSMTTLAVAAPDQRKLAISTRDASGRVMKG
jgi:hypothetical protein